MKIALPTGRKPLSADFCARLWLGLALGGVALLLGWSVLVRFSLIGEAQSMIHSSYALEHDIASLQSRWSDAEAAEIDAHVEQLQGRLFDDYEFLGRWLMDVRDQATAFGLTLDFRVGQKTVATAEVIPVDIVSIDLALQSSAPEQGYRNYIRFLRYLSDVPYIVRVKQGLMTGTGQGAMSLNLGVQVLMRHGT